MPNLGYTLFVFVPLFVIAVSLIPEGEHLIAFAVGVTCMQVAMAISKINDM